MTATQPRHAQPSALAALGWSKGVQWAGLALVSALAIGAVATVGPTARPAAAGEPPAPPTEVVSSSQLPAPSGPGAAIRGLPLLPGSFAPSSSTLMIPHSDPHDTAQASALASDGIPMTALLAYQAAARRELAASPACGLSWPLLAGIGRVESDHGRFAGAVLHTDGVSTPHIVGIALNGNGTARITDTDHGRLDGDTVYDRAVGSMQFIPSTWAGYGVDGNHDGVIDPFNIFDAAAAAAHYLCTAGGNLTTLAGQERAVRAYNDSDAYIALVLGLEGVYARGVPGLTVPILPVGPGGAPLPIPTQRPPRRHHRSPPPVNPGPPLGLPTPAPPTPAPTPAPPTPAPTSATPTSATPTPAPTSSTPTSSIPPSTSPAPSPSSCSVTATPTATPTPTSPQPTDTSCPSATDTVSSSPAVTSAVPPGPTDTTTSVAVSVSATDTPSTAPGSPPIS